MDKRSGQITEDPLVGQPIGAKINFRSMLCRPPIDAGAGSIKEWDYYGGLLFAVAFGQGKKVAIEGSAILVGPGIALSARHVFEPHLEHLKSGGLSVTLMSVSVHGIDFHLVKQIVLNDTDVCLLRTELASPLPPSGELMIATMTTRFPTVGEKIFIAGYRSQLVDTSLDNLHLETRIAVGEVSATYEGGRDKVMLPFPCFEVRSLTLGGMSGGPAFDKNGMVIGILSSSIDHADGPSYVSIIWEALTNNIETSWPNGIIECPYNLIELSEKIPNLEGRDAFSRTDSGEWVYKMWSYD